jgi:hypothetical protein
MDPLLALDSARAGWVVCSTFPTLRMEVTVLDLVLRFSSD